MSVVCAAIKNGKIAIACDTQFSFGSIKVTSRHLGSDDKFFHVKDSVIGIVGYYALFNVLEHLMEREADTFKLSSRKEIYDSFLRLQNTLKDDYFIQPKDDNTDQPVESNQLTALIANPHGIFEIGSYREVTEFQTFWAIGSGRRFALGAMHAIYDKKVTARTIVEAGVAAAVEFDDGCSAPIKSHLMGYTG